MTDLIFVLSSFNKNSFSALCGALDTQPRLTDKFNLKFVEEKEIFKKTNFIKNQIICFSLQTSDVFRIQPLIRKLKKKNQKNILLAGGPHPSGAPKHVLNMGFDYVFVGEGEKTFIDFLKESLSCKNKFGKIIIAEKTSPADITKFLPVSEKFPYFTPIEITRGCPHGCRFCQTSYLFGKIRHRTIKQIVKSAKILTEHGQTSIRFVSPNVLSYGSKDGLTPNLSKLEEMLTAVRKVKGVNKVYAGSFPSEIRPENATKKALFLLKKYSDNDNIIIGFQSGSDSLLKKMHRGHTTKQAFKAVQNALELGFKVNIDFIFGCPGETKKEEEETIKIINQLAKLPNIKIHGHTFLPLPGTPWQNEKPGKISETLKNFLNKLEDFGKIYGEWKKQEKLAEKITSLNI